MRSVSAINDKFGTRDELGVFRGEIGDVLAGFVLIREREHGAIEHLMVMPVTATEIALAKIFANGLVLFMAFVFSLFIVVAGG
ncbi:ABC transporter permease [uncultured Aliiroseovarius sp.]|uniref:ABC transporter permease n=1 Tax=uncultured Aliiroseovarius sp. TaxID=1658783 RepID=UPI002596649A|nr:ABC transporter permease [uncultured Aliiroseovarius sp.]